MAVKSFITVLYAESLGASWAFAKMLIPSIQTDCRGETERKMLNDLMAIQAKGGDLEFRDHNGATPLHVASANGYLSVVEFLLVAMA